MNSKESEQPWFCFSECVEALARSFGPSKLANRLLETQFHQSGTVKTIALRASIDTKSSIVVSHP